MSTTPLSFEGVRQGVDAANRRFEEAFNRGDAAGAARGVYTEDARILPPGAEMIQGRESIAEFWRAAGEQVRRVQLSQVDLQIQGEIAHEIGRAALTLGDGQDVQAKYVVIWKQENGQWKWHIDIWNTNQ